jgi:hypothetical protein
MNKFYVIVTPVVFAAGVFLGQYFGSGDSSALGAGNSDARAQRATIAKLTSELESKEASASKIQSLVDGVSGGADLSGLDINLDNQTAQRILENMPEDELAGHLAQFMHASDLAYIDNPRQFASRAIEAYFEPNDSVPLTGDIRITNSPESSGAAGYFDTGALPADTRLYAHLNTNGPVPVNGRIFVKWTNATTGEVVLFEKKDVADNTTQSWVSVVPKDGWTPGRYEVKFFSFTSVLEPIAQTNYSVYEVI